MKSLYFIFLVVFLFNSNLSLAQGATIEIESKKLFDSLNHLNQEVKILKQKIDSLDCLECLSPHFNGTSHTRFSKVLEGTSSQPLLFATLPIIILIPIIIVVLIKLKGFNLRRALSEDTLISEGDETRKLVESSSRLSIFISSISALVISLSIYVITVFVYLTTGILPDFGTMLNGLLALGIGVVPYSVNKVAQAIKR